MSEQKKLLAMFDALLYSVQDYSSNENVYNDDVKGEYSSFPIPEVEAMREKLAALVNGEVPRFITWDSENGKSKQDAYEQGLFTMNHGRNLAYWVEVADAFAAMPYGYSLDLTTELFIEGDYPQ